MTLDELAGLAKAIINPWLCITCGTRFPSMSRGYYINYHDKGCPICAANGVKSLVEIPYAGGDTSQDQVDQRKFRSVVDAAYVLKLIAVAKAAKRLVTATYTIADTGCFNAADDAVKQAENALTALESP